MPIEPQVIATPQSLVQIETPKPAIYKPSRFNAHTTESDGTLLLYNSFTGHRCALGPKTAEQARKYLSRVGVTGPLDTLGKYLLSKGYLVNGEVDETARFDVLYSYGQYRRDMFQLILLASEECNFRCIYCSQEFKRGTMEPRVRAAVKKLVTKRVLAGMKSFSITWFGGEPLLGYEAIEELAPYCYELGKRNGVPYSSSITTNGYLLYPERSRLMCEWGILSYQITIDGSGEVHDRHRPLAGGGSTYDQIIRNIIAMKNLPQDFEIRLRVNFDNTNSHLLEPLFCQLKEKIGSDPRYVMSFHPVGKWGGPNDDKLDICGVDADRRAQKLRQQARSFGLAAEKASEQLESGHTLCYAARPYNFVVGADGKIMKCTVVLDTREDNIIGRISDAGDLHLNEDRLLQWIKPYYQSDNTCKKCFFVPICQGASCPLPRLIHNERPCPPAKLTIRRTLHDIWAEERECGTSLHHPPSPGNH